MAGVGIENPDCVAKTYPGYWDALASLGVAMERGEDLESLRRHCEERTTSNPGAEAAMFAGPRLLRCARNDGAA